MESLVSRSLFWGAGSWNLTRIQEQKVRGVQQHMWRKILRIRQKPNELNDFYHHRVAALSARIRQKLNVPCWSDTYAKAIWTFAGHIARLGEYDPNRPTHQVLLLQNRNFLKKTEIANRGSQLHGYRFRVWRWERHFYNYTEKGNLGDWMNIAQSRRAWTEHLELWLDWRKHHK